MFSLGSQLVTMLRAHRELMRVVLQGWFQLFLGPFPQTTYAWLGGQSDTDSSGQSSGYEEELQSLAARGRIRGTRRPPPLPPPSPPPS